MRSAWRGLALGLERLGPGFQELARSPRPAAPYDPQLLAVEPGIVGEEGFDFRQQVRAEIIELLERLMGVRMRGHREEPVVALPGFALVLLLDLEHADQARGGDRSRRHGIVEEQQHVERVAVGAHGRGEEAEIVGKGQTFSKGSAQPDRLALRRRIGTCCGCPWAFPARP